MNLYQEKQYLIELKEIYKKHKERGKINLSKNVLELISDCENRIIFLESEKQKENSKVLKNAVWKEIPGFRKCYKVSDKGEIQKDLEILNFYQKDGKKFISLMDIFGKYKACVVANVVYTTFIDEIPKGYLVTTINREDDFSVDNLTLYKINYAKNKKKK